MIGVYVADKHDARLQQLEQTIRFYCRSNGGMVWLSSRLLANGKLYRGSTETMRLVRELVAAGHIGRVTARGRGRGKGRTLYWLPHVKKWQVLVELKREDMPHAAIVQALSFFVRRERAFSVGENVTNRAQQQSLGLSTVRTDDEKGMPAAPAQRSRAPSEPQRQASRRVVLGSSTPPSARRLVSKGSGSAPGHHDASSTADASHAAATDTSQPPAAATDRPQLDIGAIRRASIDRQVGDSLERMARVLLKRKPPTS